MTPFPSRPPKPKGESDARRMRRVRHLNQRLTTIRFRCADLNSKALMFTPKSDTRASDVCAAGERFRRFAGGVSFGKQRRDGVFGPCHAGRSGGAGTVFTHQGELDRSYFDKRFLRWVRFRERSLSVSRRSRPRRFLRRSSRNALFSRTPRVEDFVPQLRSARPEPRGLVVSYSPFVLHVAARIRRNGRRTRVTT